MLEVRRAFSWIEVGTHESSGKSVGTCSTVSGNADVEKNAILVRNLIVRRARDETAARR